MTEEVTHINDAIFKFQQRFNGIEKNRTNPFHKSKYASLDDVVNAVKPILLELDVLMSFSVGVQDGIQCIQLTLLHMASDTTAVSVAKLTDGADPQKFGSELTYKKRYLICSLLNIVESTDDDGNEASGVEEPVKIEMLTEKQHSTILDLIDITGQSEEKFKKHIWAVYGVEEIKDLNTRKAGSFIKALERRHEKQLQKGKE